MPCNLFQSLESEKMVDSNQENKIIYEKNAKVECLDYQIPVTQLKGPKGDGDIYIYGYNIYVGGRHYGRYGRFLLPVTYFPTNPIYPFLRVTGITTLLS